MSSFDENAETDLQRLHKAFDYEVIIDDYMKQLVKESDIMRTLGYDNTLHTDNELNNIIMNNFYSSETFITPNSLFLKLGAANNVQKDTTIYSDSLLGINGNRVLSSVNINSIKRIHKNDNRNIARRNFSKWDYTSLKSIFLHWHYLDPHTNIFKKFRETCSCYTILTDISSSGNISFDAINKFFKNCKSQYNGKTVSYYDFAEICLYLRNHISHVFVGKGGVSLSEIKDIENIIRELFKLKPIQDQDVVNSFESTTTMVITNTAATRLTAWIADLKKKYIHKYKKQESAGSSDSPQPMGPRPTFNGIELEVSRSLSKTFSLTSYFPVHLQLPEELRLRVGSRGYQVRSLKPLGACFGNSEDNICSLAVEDPYMLPSDSNANWSFDIFYDGSEWKVEIPIEAREYYTNIINTMKEIKKNKDLSDDDKKDQIKDEQKYLVRLFDEQGIVNKTFLIDQWTSKFRSIIVGNHTFIIGKKLEVNEQEEEEDDDEDDGEEEVMAEQTADIITSELQNASL